MSRTEKQQKPLPKVAIETVTAAKPNESWRDWVEQIVIAIVLAMLVRGFDAEAFVIPTGSMAPTLMGRHKEINCPQCGFLYAINASEETDAMIRRDRLEEVGVCTNCRYTTRVTNTPSFKGDRILVMKFPYELPFLPGSSGPKRWDVVVFHYPVTPETNFIKRLVGLPGEDLRIDRGNIQTRPSGTTEAFQNQHKPLYHQRAMQMMVYDDAYRAAKLRDHPEWNRWTSANGWKEDKTGHFVAAAPSSTEWARLGYRNLLPDPEQWEALDAGEKPARAPRASLITDFYGYNTNIGQYTYDNWLQPNWVGDLTVSSQVDVTKAAGKVRFELVEGGITNRCEVDLATGKATLFHGETKLGEADTALVGTGSHEVEFANVDDRLTLWVDGATPFGEGLVYAEDPTVSRAPTAADLEPVGIAVNGGAEVSVSGLVLKRDIYYTQDPSKPDFSIRNVYGLNVPGGNSGPGRVLAMFDFLSDPAQFAALGELDQRDPYVIRPDHFMMMGDNSPRSWDSRAWNSDDRAWRTVERYNWEVPRAMLIGKAFFVYWPHGKPFGPDIRLGRNFPIPFRPYLERMKWIH